VPFPGRRLYSGTREEGAYPCSQEYLLVEDAVLFEEQIIEEMVFRHPSDRVEPARDLNQAGCLPELDRTGQLARRICS
jgi:hypothetical protein